MKSGALIDPDTFEVGGVKVCEEYQEAHAEQQPPGVHAIEYLD
jgi:hypothetical protein